MTSNTLKKALLNLACLGLLCLLAACGGQLDTKLTLNENGSGQREMSFRINKEDNKNHLKTDFASAKALIEQNLPAELSLEAQDSAEEAKFKFTLKFDSIEDYTAKVAKWVEEPRIEFTVSNSAFSKGVILKENFTSSDLLKWLQETFVNANYVDSNNKHYIFNTKTDEVVIKEKPYKLSSHWIEVKDMIHHPLKRLDYVTTQKANDNYDRSIVISIPQLSMEQSGDEIKKFFAERGKGFKSTWSSENGLQTITLVAEDQSILSLNKLMNTFYGTSHKTYLTLEADAYYSPLPDDFASKSKFEQYPIYHTGLLSMSASYKEEMNFKDFSTLEYKGLPFTYKVNNEGRFSIGSAKKRVAPGQSLELHVSDPYSFTPQLNYRLFNAPVLSRANYDIDLTGSGEKHAITLGFEGEFSDELLNLAKEKANELLKDTGISATFSQLKPGEVRLTYLLQSKDSEEASASLKKGLGLETSSSLTHSKKGLKLFDIYQASLDAQAILQEAEPALQYRIFFNGQATQPNKEEKLDGLYVTSTKNFTHVTLIMERLNKTLLFLIIGGVLLFLVAIAVLVIVLVKKGNKKETPTDATASADTEAVLDASKALLDKAGETISAAGETIETAGEVVKEALNGVKETLSPEQKQD